MKRLVKLLITIVKVNRICRGITVGKIDPVYGRNLLRAIKHDDTEALMVGLRFCLRKYKIGLVNNLPEMFT